MNIERQPQESLMDYHKRLIYGKLVDRTLADVDYVELSEKVYGQPYSSDVARRMMYGSRKTLELMDSMNLSAVSDKNMMSEIDEKILELRKEKQKMYDQRVALNSSIRARSRQEELNEILTNAILTSKMKGLEYQPHDIVHSDNDLLVSLNDIHYGANVHNAWNVYNSDICAEMMRSYLDRIIEIGKRHSSENCIVWANGDLISGNIHYSIAVTNKENVIQQITGVSELIATFLAELSEHFSTVSFISVAGNHSRISPNKENSLHTERLDDLVEWYIKARLQNFKNVFVMNDKIDETMYTIDIRGKTYLGIHGDYDGSAAKVQSLQTLAGKPVYAILSGHLHHNRVESIQGIKTVMAGSFMGVDDFCVQKRIYGTPEQMVCVCDDTGIVCYYDIDLKTT